MTGNTVLIEWQGTGPSESNQNTDFTCRLDFGPFNRCELNHTTNEMVQSANLSCCFSMSAGSSTEGFNQTGLSVGPHLLIIRPAVNSLCTRRIGLRVDFVIFSSYVHELKN